MGTPIKADAVLVFQNRSGDALSDIAVDCRGFNAVAILVLVSGATPSATVTVEGALAEGGPTYVLSDPSATQAAVNSSRWFESSVPSGFVRIRLSSVTGTFLDGQGYTIWAIPYQAGGQTAVTINNTAAQNLTQVGGAGISEGQKAMAASLPVVIASNQSAVPVSGPLTDAQLRASAVPVDTEMPAAAALGDAVANPTAPQVGAAAEGYNGATWERLRVPVVFKNIAAQAVTASTPVTIWTPATGKRFRVLGYALSLSVAGSVILKDETTEILRTPLMAAGIGLVQPQMGNGILSAVANNTLKIDVSASGNVSGYVYGVEE